MPNIHVLDKAVAELIAAGEVVERPSSIAKELIENAIDAGATVVTVELRGGGVAFLRVIDNGCGISRGDVPTAFIRHATSKVRTQSDLDAILTLGFRGEALPSIASVSKLELVTRTEDETEGTRCRVEGGELRDIEPAGCPVGTTITVEELFYNTPARMKFLKTDTGEGNSVALTVEKCALSHPDIAFRLIRDGSTKLTTSGSGDLLAVIRAVYGKELAAAMLAIDYEYENKIRVHGYISRPESAKSGRTYQNFFLNSRYVRTRTASAALEEGFKTRLMGGKFPACALHIDINPETVDVNVHPAKIEVRFADERPVFHAVYFAVKSALTGGAIPTEIKPPEPIQPKLTLSPQTTQQHMSSADFLSLFDKNKPVDYSFNKPLSLGRSSSLDIEVDETLPPAPFRITQLRNPSEQEHAIPAEGGDSTKDLFVQDETEQPKYDTITVEARLIGEAFGTYILVERGDELLLVDKHAAHERIRYERLKAAPADESRQVLLAPLAVRLSREDYGAITENIESVAALGFDLDDFGDSTILVREIPMLLGQQDAAAILEEIAGKLRAGSHSLTPEVIDRLFYSIACKSAVRAGDKSAPEELAAILKKLAENPEITHCPHGRPVSIKLTRAEIERRFGRLG
jgi:DNA mismatch repair protein MutL